MRSLLYSLFTFYIATSYGQTWNDLPPEVISHEIFSALPIKEKSKSVLLLNQHGESHFNTYHQKDVKLYEQLLAEITSPNEIHNLEIIHYNFRSVLQ